MILPTKPSYAGYRFPPELISHVVWLYFHFQLSLRMVEEMLAARGILVSHETLRQWACKFGQAFATTCLTTYPTLYLMVSGKFNAIGRCNVRPIHRRLVTRAAGGCLRPATSGTSTRS